MSRVLNKEKKLAWDNVTGQSRQGKGQVAGVMLLSETRAGWLEVLSAAAHSALAGCRHVLGAGGWGGQRVGQTPVFRGLWKGDRGENTEGGKLKVSHVGEKMKKRHRAAREMEEPRL